MRLVKGEFQPEDEGFIQGCSQSTHLPHEPASLNNLHQGLVQNPAPGRRC